MKILKIWLKKGRLLCKSMKNNSIKSNWFAASILKDMILNLNQ